MRFLYIQCGPSCPPGLMSSETTKRKHTMDVIYAYDQGAFNEVNPGDYIGIFISGSRATSHMKNKYPWVNDVISFVQWAIVSYNIPVMGICLGSQVLAEAVGGRAIQCPRGAFFGEYKPIWIKNNAINDPIYGKIIKILSNLNEKHFPVYLAHNDTFAFDKNTFNGMDIKLIQKSDYGYNTIYKVGDYIYGIQSHPELDTWLREQWINLDYAHWNKVVGVSKQEMIKQYKKKKK
eukprot:495860_1